MNIVILYLGTARFTGGANFEWASPALGGSHRFILFLVQNDGLPNLELARLEVESFGFSEIDLSEGRQIDVESLNDPKMAVFRRHYEGALREGSSLVWYP